VYAVINALTCSYIGTGAELTPGAPCGGAAVFVGQLAGHVVHVHLPQGWQGWVVKLVLHTSQLH